MMGECEEGCDPSPQKRQPPQQEAEVVAVERCGDRDLDPELIRSVRLTLADALHLRGMQRIDLPAPLALALILDAPSQRQGTSEHVGEFGPGCDLATDVPDGPA